jgi:hypothetical protein
MEKDLNWKPSRLAQSQAETAGQRLDYGKDEGDRANASLSRESISGRNLANMAEALLAESADLSL